MFSNFTGKYPLKVTTNLYSFVITTIVVKSDKGITTTITKPENFLSIKKSRRIQFFVRLQAHKAQSIQFFLAFPGKRHRPEKLDRPNTNYRRQCCLWKYLCYQRTQTRGLLRTLCVFMGCGKLVGIV